MRIPLQFLYKRARDPRAASSPEARRALPYNQPQVRPRPSRTGLGLLVVAFAAIGSTASGPDALDELETETKRFVEVFGLLDRHLADAFDPAAAIYGGGLPPSLLHL